MNALTNDNWQVVSNAVAAGVTAINCDSVDLKDHSGVEFCAVFGAITAGAATSVKAQGSDNNSDWSDLTGTSITVADDEDDTAFVIDLSNPIHRYARMVVLRATQNAVLEAAVARMYGPGTAPTTQGATVSGSETHVAPAVGTP